MSAANIPPITSIKCNGEVFLEFLSLVLSFCLFLVVFLLGGESKSTVKYLSSVILLISKYLDMIIYDFDLCYILHEQMRI